MSNVHFISIGGSVMHSLAIALKNSGYNISGSDDKIYEPSLSRLKQNGICPKAFGWFPENINPDLDFVILGMHAKLDNPELLKAQDLQIKIYSYPEFIYEFSLKKTRIVIGGSHGKTSITSMILHVLNYNNINVDYVLGAQLDGFENPVSLSNDNEFNFPYLQDETQEIAKAYDAVCTPDFFGYNKDLGLQYRGRLRELKNFVPVKDGESDLLKAMKQIAETGKGPQNQIPSAGCGIKWKFD